LQQSPAKDASVAFKERQTDIRRDGWRTLR
jgi:hypothetical protein